MNTLLMILLFVAAVSAQSDTSCTDTHFNTCTNFGQCINYEHVSCNCVCVDTYVSECYNSATNNDLIRTAVCYDPCTPAPTTITGTTSCTTLPEFCNTGEYTYTCFNSTVSVPHSGTIPPFTGTTTDLPTNAPTTSTVTDAPTTSTTTDAPTTSSTTNAPTSGPTAIPTNTTSSVTSTGTSGNTTTPSPRVNSALTNTIEFATFILVLITTNL